ncbi:hypothetical protein [Zavarzinella formosa]|uniref:hypothetical protein n=1 Tax=Zavarzinella formosa TaxID=360055 RepID=UPI0002F3B243|nr:hypothetical protein [Zavarzinella formosa]
MSLLSQLFRGDPKLEAAAVSDPAHITPGASGAHVRKIQQALVFVDGAKLTPDGAYGAATAAAVLAYKQKRKIINRAYQTSADDIVGKMTMTALDLEVFAAENKPLLLAPVHPFPKIIPARQQQGPAFKVTSSNPLKITDLNPIPVPPAGTPGPGLPTQEVIIAQGGIGTIRIVGGKGGNVVRSQLIHFYGQSKNSFQVAKMRGAKTPDKNFEEMDIQGDDITVTFDALFCGETFFQARVSPPQPPQKLSGVMRLLSLVDKVTVLSLPPGDYSPDPRFKTGLVSKEGTPLNPKPGRKINLFGEGESAGFEDYSSDIDFCSHTFSNGNAPAGVTIGNRPWTNDPRKPPGIPDKSVNNISCRGSPIFPVTINEILRIGASGCRVTYGEAIGRTQCDKLRAGLTTARLIDEGVWGKSGFAVVFELA